MEMDKNFCFVNKKESIIDLRNSLPRELYTNKKAFNTYILLINMSGLPISLLPGI